jgi:hypothetical protein
MIEVVMIDLLICQKTTPCGMEIAYATEVGAILSSFSDRYATRTGGKSQFILFDKILPLTRKGFEVFFDGIVCEIKLLLFTNMSFTKIITMGSDGLE